MCVVARIRTCSPQLWMTKLCSLWTTRVGVSVQLGDSAPSKFDLIKLDMVCPQEQVTAEQVAGASVRFPTPTELIAMTKAAIGATRGRLVPGARYVRRNHPHRHQPTRLDDAAVDVRADCDRRDIGPTIDAITKWHGTGTIGLGLGGIRAGPVWQTRRGRLSLRPTTHWAELVTVSSLTARSGVEPPTKVVGRPAPCARRPAPAHHKPGDRGR